MKSSVGVVNGLSFEKEEGKGKLISIEAGFFTGTGKLIIASNLQNTMKGSAEVAIACIKNGEEEFKALWYINYYSQLIQNNLSPKKTFYPKYMTEEYRWNEIDISVHAPSEATNKDGPSAGIAITTAALSAFRKKPIPDDIAMTGEITLTGKILSIDYLKERIIYAANEGIEKLFFPKENERELEYIPLEIKEKIELKPVESCYEIYKAIWK